MGDVVPAGKLDVAVDALIDDLLALSPLALTMAKRVLGLAEEAPVHSSHDFEEGSRAFLEKRRPDFEGR